MQIDKTFHCEGTSKVIKYILTLVLVLLIQLTQFRVVGIGQATAVVQANQVALLIEQNGHPLRTYITQNMENEIK
jgi:hypothetical protein